jgi:hypothetical protein
MITVHTRSTLAMLTVAISLASTVGRAAPVGANCDSEAAALAKDESELPRLEVASPEDRPPYCITLETIIAFAGKLKAHVAHCPGSSFAPSVAEWDKTRADYSKLFTQTRCKPTIRR